jgi:uridylate kinase
LSENKLKGKCVIKIGGSLLFKDGNNLDSEKITDFCNIIKNKSNYDSIVVICGGGILAREYINVVRKFSGNEALCDTFGIEISRINSKLIIACLNESAFPQVPKTIEELSIAMLHEKILVMGGLQPGQSTTSVAIEVAEYINAENLVILTDVEGIYDKDPKKFKDAILLKKLTYKEVQEKILDASGINQAAAGEYRIFDAVSLQILKRSKIEAFIMSGIDLSQFGKFWKGEKNVIGTRITN